jgi:hypothetical protein
MQVMPNDKLRQSLNVCFAVAQPVVAALTQLEVTGPSIGEISDLSIAKSPNLQKILDFPAGSQYSR